MASSGSHHARHRAVSVPAGLKVTVDRELREPARRRTVRGRVGRAPERRRLGVPSGAAALR